MDIILDKHKQMFYTYYNLMQGCEVMEENKLSIQNEISNEEIKNLIYTIRGKQVMLDSDVAMLYHYPTKRINETVNRNKQRFPENFCFQLTDEEYEVLRCKDITLNKDRVYKKILIIDNYVNDSILKMLTAKKKNNVEVIILTSNKGNIQDIDIKKFNKEYPILKVAKTNKFHDRFIVIDNK